MNSQTSTKQTKTRPNQNTAKSEENISAMNKMKTYTMYVKKNVYVIGHSPSGLFRTNVNK